MKRILPIEYKAHLRSLMHTGVPIMLGQLGTIIMGLADTLMVGRYSTDALAAAGFVNNIIGLTLILGLGFSYGLTPIVSALFGRGETCLIAEKLKNSLLANNLLSLVLAGLMLLLWVAMPQLGLPAELLPLMRPYLLILTVSILPQMAFNALKQFSEGIQETTTPMWVLLGTNALNIILNWVLIFGHLGCPAMGLTGAGVATLLSRIAAWGMMSLLFHSHPRYRNFARAFGKSHVHTADLREMNRMGLPLALQMGMETASFSLSAVYVGWLGSASLAAHQILITIGQLCFMLYYGLSAAVAVMVGYYRGRNEFVHTRMVARAGLWVTWTLGLLCVVPLFLLRHQIGGWFTHSSEVSQLVASAIIPMVIYQFGDGLQCIYANALRGMADVRPLVPIAFFAYFVVSLPLGYVFGFQLDGGLVGVWMAFPFGLTTAGIFYYLRFTQTYRKSISHE